MDRTWTTKVTGARKFFRSFFFLILLLFLKIIFWSHYTACGILVPRPGIQPTHPALEAWNLNHFERRQFLDQILFQHTPSGYVKSSAIKWSGQYWAPLGPSCVILYLL